MQWRLIFSGLQSWGWPLLVVSSIVIAFAVCLLLMQLERRLISQRVGWMLLAIRTGVLAWLLLIMLQPVVTSEWDVSESGRVIVAIDTSESMATADRHASAEEKIRWAMAIGMLSNSMDDAEISRYAATLSGRREIPDAAADAAAQPEAPISDARLKQLAEVVQEFDRMPRQEFVKRLLTNRSDPMLKQMESVAAVDVRLFSTDQQSIDDDAIPAAANPLTGSLGPSATDAVGLLSDLTAEQDGNLIRGIVLLSDGRQTEPGDLGAQGRRLGSLQIPVYSIPIGSRLKPRDISIASIESPDAVFLDDSAMLNVVLGTSGFEGTPVTVQLERDGVPVESRTITPAASSARVTFTAPTTETGRFEYRVSVAEQPGELRADNNDRTVSFQVVDNKGRVLLVDGDARWELRYLKNLLERDKQVELTSVVFRQPYLQLLNKTFIDRALPQDDALRQQLEDTDLLIVGDVSAGQLTEKEWSMIDEAVSKDGLTLVVIPGRRGFRELDNAPSLRTMLPVDSPSPLLAERYRPSAGDGTQSVFQLEPADAAADLPMFQFADADHPNVNLQNLPGHPWICTGTPKASATTWAWALNPLDRFDREPVIVHQYYGFGQVIWMGIDSTWRWRQRRGDSMHHKFWGQFVRWAARNRTAAGNDQVRLTLSDVVVDVTESVDVVARFSARAVAELGDSAVEVLITPVQEGQGGDNENAAAVDPVRTRLTAVSDAPQRLKGRIPPLPAGSWNVALQIDGHQEMAEGVASELVVQPRKSPELADVSCHRDALQQLSEASGGQLIEPWALADLLELLRPEEILEAKISERSLWDHWSALVVFFALLMTEWVTRKLNGLP